MEMQHAAHLEAGPAGRFHRQSRSAAATNSPHTFQAAT